jgi:hypothetical protein
VLDGVPEIVELFVDCADVNVNALTPKGSTPWVLALLERKYRILELLVDRQEVDVNAFLQGIGTALGAAVVDGDVPLVNKLLVLRKIEIRGVGPVRLVFKMESSSYF